MRALVWLLIAALLILTAAYPSIALLLADLVEAVASGLLSGAGQLLAQPAIVGLLAVTVAVRLYRPRRTA